MFVNQVSGGGRMGPPPLVTHSLEISMHRFRILAALILQNGVLSCGSGGTFVPVTAETAQEASQ